MNSWQILRSKRGEQGFTMMEVLIVVAIVVIMGGLVTLSLSEWQKNLYQLEMDGTAKEIYVAAQNHLTTAAEQGSLEWVGDKGQDAGEKNVYYFEVNPGNAAMLYKGSNSLAQMLPFGSIDDTVRLGGSYVICYEYQSDAKIARVLDVYYSNPSGKFPATVAVNGSYATFKDTYSGAQNSENRRRYLGQANSIIGWYGGEEGVSLQVPTGELNAPTLRVENAERLRVYIEDMNMQDATKSQLRADLKLVIKGSTSGNVAKIDLVKKGQYVAGASSNALFYTAPNKFVIDLDDITDSGCLVAGAASGHIVDLPSDIFDITATGTSGFIPGEDIEIQAIASTSVALASDVASNTITTNSLFNSISSEKASEDAPATERKLVISSIRHLENLGYAISGYSTRTLMEEMVVRASSDSSSTQSSGMQTGTAALPQAGGSLVAQADNTVLPITGALQVNDLSWTRFLRALQDANYDEVTGTSTSANGGSSSQYRVYAAGSNTPLSVWNSFAPVTPQYVEGYALNYDGDSFRVSDIVARNGDVDGNAGMFGTLKGGSVKDLELVNFDVGPRSGSESGEAAANLKSVTNAGALAGSISAGTSVSGVVAYNIPEGDANDKDLEITGSGSVGGLIGLSESGSVSASGAALYVRSTAGSAGGLVGSASGGSISNNYAGGHTVNGNYSKDVDFGTVGRVNVQAASNAGGLVGEMANTTVKCCYTTCSAAGNNVGGFVGNASGGSVAYSYATGLVVGTQAGAFAGAINGTGTKDGNKYLGIMNYDPKTTPGKALPAIADDSDGGITPADADTASYNTFAANSAKVGGEESTAAPYDAALSNVYPYQMVADLLTLSGQAGDAPGTHHGDWPTPEKLVVNTQ